MYTLLFLCTYTWILYVYWSLYWNKCDVYSFSFYFNLSEFWALNNYKLLYSTNVSKYMASFFSLISSSYVSLYLYPCHVLTNIRTIANLVLCALRAIDERVSVCNFFFSSYPFHSLYLSIWEKIEYNNMSRYITLIHGHIYTYNEMNKHASESFGQNK